MTFTYLDVQNFYKKAGYKFLTDAGAINICGIRSNTGQTVTDKFDDYIIVTYLDGTGQIKVYPGTTDPGMYFMLKPMNTRGTIRMIPGFYENAYVPGTHISYYALRQRLPIRFWVDNDKDTEYDEAKQINEVCGANIHHGYDSRVVGNNSAGCQVIWHIKDQQQVMRLVDAHVKNEHGNFFNYALFTEKELTATQPALPPIITPSIAPIIKPMILKDVIVS